MTFVQLGFLETLQKIFATLFEEVFSPLLQKALEAIFKVLLGMLHSFLSSFLLASFTKFLSIVDYVAKIYDILTGVETVSYRKETGLSLAEALLKINTIGRAFIILTAVSIVLAFLFSIVSVARSMADSPFENKHPISEVLKWSLKSALTFAMIPLLCLFLVHFSKTVVKVTGQIEYTDTRAGNHNIIIADSTAGDVLFVTMVQDAIKVPDKYKTAEDRSAYVQQRLDYYMTRYGDLASEKFTYSNMDQVLEDVDPMKVNYILAFPSVFCLLALMMMSSVMLVRRMFEMLVLYVVSPFFAASIALDGGAIFKKWKDLFVGKFFAGVGTVITMKIFLIILPFMASNRIHFTDDAFMNKTISVLFVLGGAWAVFNASITIGQVLDPDSASEEQSQRSAIISYMTGKLSNMGSGGQQNAGGRVQRVGGGPQGPTSRG